MTTQKAQRVCTQVENLLDELAVEVQEAGERLDELEKSDNPELAGVVKLARQFAHSMLWVVQANANAEWWCKSLKSMKLLTENGTEFLEGLREARDKLADTETRDLLGKLGFYEGK